MIRKGKTDKYHAQLRYLCSLQISLSLFFSSVLLYLRWINPEPFHHCFTQLLCFFLLSLLLSEIFSFPNSGYFYHSNFSVRNQNSFTWIANKHQTTAKESLLLSPLFSLPSLHLSVSKNSSDSWGKIRYWQNQPGCAAAALNEAGQVSTLPKILFCFIQGQNPARVFKSAKAIRQPGESLVVGGGCSSHPD